MAIRAYRINEIQTEEHGTFNLIATNSIMGWLIENGFGDQLFMFGGSIIAMLRDTLETMLIEADIDPETKKAIQKDIKWMQENNYDIIRYILY